MKQAGNHFEIVRLNITLLGMDPGVTRRMDVFANTRLDDLHLYIQAAMGWSNFHFWGFRAVRYGQVAQWNAEFDESSCIPILESDDTIFNVMDFLDGKPVFTYMYDYGDSWEHRINIGKIKPSIEGRQYPYLDSGRGCCPLENIGGTWGYADFLKAFDDPDSRFREIFPHYFDGSTSWDPEDARLEQKRAKLAQFGSLVPT